MLLLAVDISIWTAVVGCSELECVETGYKNWKKFLDPTSGFRKHAGSRMHQLSLERHRGCVSSRANLTVHEQLSEQATQDRSRKETENARRPFDCALFLSKQGLAFLGHDESQTFSNRGNFLELVHFLSKYSQQLHRWLESRGNMSPDIRDKKIAIDAKKIRCSLQFDSYWSIN